MSRALAPHEFELVRLALDAGADAVRQACDRLLGDLPKNPLPVTRWGGSASEFSGREGEHQLVSFDVHGSISAHLTLVTGQQSASAIANALLNRAAGGLDEQGQHALREMSNIVASAFLNGVARVARLRLLPSVPLPSAPTVEALAGQVLPAVDRSFTVRFDTHLPGGPLDAAILVVLPSEALERLVAALNHSRRG